jgi:hypothetical protein
MGQAEKVVRAEALVLDDHALQFGWEAVYASFRARLWR